jgi:hypothetical protein
LNNVDIRPEVVSALPTSRIVMRSMTFDAAAATSSSASETLSIFAWTMSVIRSSQHCGAVR